MAQNAKSDAKSNNHGGNTCKGIFDMRFFDMLACNMLSIGRNQPKGEMLIAAPGIANCLITGTDAACQLSKLRLHLIFYIQHNIQSATLIHLCLNFGYSSKNCCSCSAFFP